MMGQGCYGESASVQHAAGVVPIALLLLKKLELTFPVQRDARLTLWTGCSPGFLQCAWVSEMEGEGKMLAARKFLSPLIHGQS